MNKKYYAWVICFSCFITLYTVTGIAWNNFSVFTPFMHTEYGLTNTQLSSLTTIRAIASLIAVALTGRYYKFFTLRRGMLCAGILSASSFLLFSRSAHFPAFLIGSAMVGTAYGFGTNIPMTLALGRWFQKKRKFATGICTLASSASLIGTPTLFTYIIEHFGLSLAFFAAGCIIITGVILCFLLIRNDPGDIGTVPYGSDSEETIGDTADSAAPDSIGGASEGNAASSAGVSGSRHGAASKKNRLAALNERYAIRTQGLSRPEWWSIIGAVALLGVFTNTAYGHMTVYFAGEGIPAHSIAWILSIAGIAVASSKFMYGVLCEKFPSYLVNLFYFICSTAGAFGMVFFVHNVPLLTLSVVIVSIGWSLCGPGQIAWAWDLCTPEQSADAIRYFQVFYNVGAVASSLMPGMIADRCGGSYLLAFVIFAVMTIPMAVAVQYLYKKKIRA